MNRTRKERRGVDLDLQRWQLTASTVTDRGGCKPTVEPLHSAGHCGRKHETNKEREGNRQEISLTRRCPGLP